ncbi:MAG: ATP-binding cassette domain-containing protein, partial [Acidimicrobiia bacterium]|nr:ATP-binding cassette domain-containing protein [Acidimicrobiia bacterium]
MAEIRLEGVTKRFPDGTVAVHGFDLEIGDGELMVLVGPSGCGKSTVLRMVAGLETVTEGTISVGGKVANDLSPGDRDLAMVFQDYALYPHMTAYQNMAFALKAKRRPRGEVDATVREAAQLLGIEALLGRRPRALSGGERQRVAMGRAIVRQPSAFLMDEPLSNLDAKLRVELRSEIRRLHTELAATFLYVTHDQVEAMTMGDRGAVMQGGKLQQAGPPAQVYAAPANVFVAAFMGSPPMNLCLAPIAEAGGRRVAQVGPWAIPLPHGRAAELDQVVVGIRPEHLGDPRSGRPDGSVEADVVGEVVEPLGALTLVHFHIDAAAVSVAPGAGT